MRFSDGDESDRRWLTLNTYGHLFPDAFNDVGEALDRLVRASSEAGTGTG